MFQLVFSYHTEGGATHYALLLCSLLLTVNHLVQAVHFFCQEGFISADLAGVALFASFGEVVFLSQRSVRIGGHRSHLSNPRTDLLEHLLASGQLLVVFVKSLLLLSESLLLNLVVKQLFQESLLLSVDLVVLVHIHLVVRLSSGSHTSVLRALFSIDLLESNVVSRPNRLPWSVHHRLVRVDVLKGSLGCHKCIILLLQINEVGILLHHLSLECLSSN